MKDFLLITYIMNFITIISFNDLYHLLLLSKFLLF